MLNMLIKLLNLFKKEEPIRRERCDFCGKEMSVKAAITIERSGMLDVLCPDCFKEYSRKHPEIVKDVVF